jgi:hypothetical protein
MVVSFIGGRNRRISRKPSTCRKISIYIYFTIRFVPESYRWLLTNGKIKEAHAVISKIAKWNGKPEPNITELTTVVELHRKTINGKKYTLIDVLRRPSFVIA